MGCASSAPASDKPTELTTAASVPEDPQKARANATTSEAHETFTLSSECGISIRYACMSQRGYNPDDLYEANQDAFGVVRDLKTGSSDDPHLLLGVFDGAGGEGAECAQWVRKEVGSALTAAVGKTPDDHTAACKAAVLALNQQLIASDSVDASYSGTTALTAWFHGKHVHVTNVRDPRARSAVRPRWPRRLGSRTGAYVGGALTAARAPLSGARAPMLTARAARAAAVWRFACGARRATRQQDRIVRPLRRPHALPKGRARANKAGARSSGIYIHAPAAASPPPLRRLSERARARFALPPHSAARWSCLLRWRRRRPATRASPR